MVGFQSRLGGPDLGRFNGGSRGFVMIPQICDCSLLCLFTREKTWAKLLDGAYSWCEGGCFTTHIFFFPSLLLVCSHLGAMRCGLMDIFQTLGFRGKSSNNQSIRSCHIVLGWHQTSCYDLGALHTQVQVMRNTIIESSSEVVPG